MKDFPLYLVLFITFTFLSCADDDPLLDTTEDYNALLASIANDVIVPTYIDLKKRANALEQATAQLEDDPNQDNLTSTRQAWVEARSPWEQSEGFLFGPVDEEGLDPSLDSWPVNVTDLDNVLTSSNELTVEFLEAQEGTLKGFHTIEYLLWGENGEKNVMDFTEREFEYLSSAAGALAKDATTLANLWLPEDGNYVEYLLTAGHNNLFPSQKSAVEQIVDALIIIADEVGNGKINDPFSTQDLTLEESRFSANSKADFADNIRSIQNIYLGEYSSQKNGKGISTIIIAEDAKLHASIVSLIGQTILAIENIPGSFSEAIFNHPEVVKEAQQMVRTLQSMLEVDVTNIISGL